MKTSSFPRHGKLLHINYFRAPKVNELTPFVIPPHTELIELVTDGTVYFGEESKTLKLGCGALFWHAAGEKTIHRTEITAPYECLVLGFDVGPKPIRPAPRLSMIQDRQRALELSRELLQAYHDDSIDRNILASYARQRLLWEVHLSSGRGVTPDLPHVVKMAAECIKKEFRSRSLNMTGISKTVRLSESRLHFLFRENLGQTPHQYLTACRIREAKLLLSDDAHAIKAIAHQSGFENIETFYRSFKKHVGITPNEYRKAHSFPGSGGATQQ